MPAHLPAAARRMILGTGLSAVGTGLTLPFTLILLHEVRGFPLPTTGLLLGIPGVVGLAAVPLSGALVDRFGPRSVLRAALLLQVLANLLLAHATTVPAAAAALVPLGLGLGPSFPAASALLSGLVNGAEAQSRAFGMQFTVLNAGIGMAALAGAAVADVDRPSTFVLLFTANAALTALFAALVPPRLAPPVRDGDTDAAPGYREVLADPAFRLVLVVSLLLALSGYAALDSGLPAYARVVGHISPGVIALVFSVNTAVIVLGQLLMLRLLAGRRRSTALIGAAALWGLSWAVLGALALLPAGGPRVAAALVFGGVFGLGETLMAPVLSPLVNALASPRLRGRYNALSGASFSVAFVVAPAVSGLLIGYGLGAVWIALLLGGCAGVVVASRRLRGRLTPEQDGLQPAPADGPAVPAVAG